MKRLCFVLGALLVCLPLAAAELSHVPQVPQQVRDLLEGRKYDEAVTAIDKLLAAKPQQADYLTYLKGRALHLAGKYREAIAAFAALEQQQPNSPWVRRARFGRAEALLKLRDFQDAEKIFEAEAQYLLSTQRKQEVAGIYLEFADAYFKPQEKDKQPDYQKAFNYYQRALEVGPAAEKRDEAEYRIARCQQQLNNLDEAIARYQKFLKDHPKSTRDVDARFELGMAQLTAGQMSEARRTWRDLLAAYPDPKQRDEAVRNRLAEASFQIAHTYGLPTPMSKEDLDLGVSAATAFIAEWPDNKFAPQAALEIAQGYIAHNRLEDAVAALKKLIANEKFAQAEVLPVARQLLGTVYLRQKKFDTAIAVWQEYLARHPAHHGWSAVQRSIIDAEFFAGAEARRTRQFDKARKLWNAFLVKYPLSERSPLIMLQFGLMHYDEQKYTDSIADWERLVSKYPGTEEASRAQYLIGLVNEQQLGKFDAALEAYRKLNWGSYTPRAQARVAQLTEQQLKVVTPRVFRTNQKAVIRVTTRNIEELTVKAYKIDLETYFRKMHLARGVEHLNIALIDPDKSWTYKVPDYVQHKRLVGDIEIPLDGPGVMAVTVSNEPKPTEKPPAGINVRPQEATTMLVTSDLDVLVKCSRNELFVYAQNMRTGKPQAGAQLLISDGQQVFAEGVTNDQGVFIGAVSETHKTFEPLKTSGDIRVFAMATPQQAGGAAKANEGKQKNDDAKKAAAPAVPPLHVASNVVGIRDLEFAQGLSPKGFLYTDRPAYRAGHWVRVRGIVRWVQNDQFTFEPGKQFKLEVFDSRGRRVRSDEVKLGDFGTFSLGFQLADSSPQGQYRMHLFDPAAPEEHNYQGSFLVHEYQLEPIQITLDTPRKVYFRGEEVTATIELKYYYGLPLAGREISYNLPDGTTQTAKTDEAGKFELKFDTRQFREDQILEIEAIYPDRNLVTTAQVFLATRGFEASVETQRDVYITGETFDVKVSTSDPSGEKIAQKLKLEVIEQTEVDGQIGERLVEEKPLATDAKTGQGRLTLKLDKPGFFTLRVSGTDQFNNVVTAETEVEASGEEDAVRLRILADAHLFKAGDTANVNVHWRDKPALALVTYQGARVLGYRLVELKTGMNKLAIEMEEKLAPNFDLTISVMSDTGGERRFGEQRKPEENGKQNEPQLALPSFHEAESWFEVERPLTIAIKPAAETVAPGGELEVEITTTDPQGKPVSAEVSLAMVEQNLLARFPDRLGPLAQLFQSERRESSLQTVATCTFRYAPHTHAISETLITEARREAVLALEVEQLAQTEGEIQQLVEAAPDEMQDVAEVTVESLFESNLNRPGGFGGFGGPVDELQQLTDGQFRDFGLAGHSMALNGAVGGGGQFGAGYLGGFGGGQQMQKLQEQTKAIQGRWGESPSARPAPGPDGMPQATSTYFRSTVALAFEGNNGGDRSGGGEQGGGQRSGAGGMNFPSHETGYWNPAIVTDKNGKAKVTFSVPSRSSAWQLTSRGITTGTLSGEATASVISKQDLFGELTLPLAYVDGDSTRVIATVHNNAIATGQIEVTLKTTIAGKVLSETKKVDVKAKGLLEVPFERTMAGTGEAKFELIVKAGKEQHELARSVPIRPYGIPVYSAVGGTGEANMTAWISPPAEMEVRNPQLSIIVGPSIQRSLLDVVLGSSHPHVYHDRLLICGSGLERTTSDLLASVGLLNLLGKTRDEGTPEATQLADAARAAISFLVSSQNDDGGWSWSGAKAASNRETSARALWALAVARQAGFAVPDQTWSQGVQYVQTQFTKARESDYRGKSVLLFALTVAGHGDFAYANRLYRARQQLDAESLVHLSLVFAEMDRNEISKELLDLLAPKLPVLKAAADEPTGHEFSGVGIPMSENTEVRALHLLVLLKVSPADAAVRQTAEWLLAHRSGNRWQPERATGPAALAVARYFARAQFASEKYKLIVSVNDAQVAEFEMDPAKGSRVIEVPAALLARGEKLPGAGDRRRQRINFELTGRGQFTYQAVLGGFVEADRLQNTADRWRVNRYYEPAPLEMDGREIPRGFDVLTGSYTTWRNTVTQLPIGKRATVRLSVNRSDVSNKRDDELDYLVVTEPIPSGAQVVETSISGNYERYEIGPGHITFYVGNRRYPGDLQFDLFGYAAGKFRVAPTVVRSYYEPQWMRISGVGKLDVLPAGEKSADEYKLTPRELFELGSRYLAKKDYTSAYVHLSQLLDNFQLRPEFHKQTAQMLFEVSLRQKKSDQIVRYFELLKERYPELELSFEQIFQVGAAYRDMNEYERSYLVFRATAEASFQRESQVAGFLDSQGEFLRSVEVMDRLLREYPAEPYIASSTYALAQQIYVKAATVADDMALVSAGLSRVHLIREAIHRLDDFLTVWPDDPAADEASFSLATALVELENWKDALARCEQFAARYPDSKFLDSYWYVMGYSDFALGKHDQALELCRKVAAATRKDPSTGRLLESDNKWRAIYITGQIHHALGQPAAAIAEYEKVEDRFADAREAVEYFNRKAIELPEITTLRPGEKAVTELKYRNVAQCEVKVYRIDLMKFSLLERDLSGITRINLAGIRPLLDTKIELGNGKDYADKAKQLELPLKDEGAYLIVCRGDNLHASGLALITPLKIDVQEEVQSGRVRATVKNTVTDKYSPDVDVKVIGSHNERFTDGQTDLRGVFVADGICGHSTVIARAGDGQYAFYRGTTDLGTPPPAATQPNAEPDPAQKPQSEAQKESNLLEDLLKSNRAIQMRNDQQLKQLYDNKTKGVKTKAAY